MKKISRRNFLALAGVSAVTAVASPSILAASDEENCVFASPVVKLIGTVTDAGEVVSAMKITYGFGTHVLGVDKETFTVHAKNNIDAIRAGTDIVSYGDYDIDRKIISVDVKDNEVTLTFDRSEGATLCYASTSRNYPGDISYTVIQNKPLTVASTLGIVRSTRIFEYTCDNIVHDPDIDEFESVKIAGGINYQLYKPAEGSDKLVVWFHGNGEGDMLHSGNNVAQIRANRGGAAWVSEEFQSILGGAYVMAFQAPETWYYAQRDGLLDIAADEIRAVVEEYGINPRKIIVNGCSAGGYMTSRMIIRHPTLFAVAIINCPAYSVADDRGGEKPTDAELKIIRDSGVPIWLVQGETDGVVATDECSKRLFAVLTDGTSILENHFVQADSNNSDFTTWETPDNKYKLSLYETTEDGKLRFAEDYDCDGKTTEVQYSNHWSWIYSLRNNPKAADGTHIVNWAVGKIL